MLENHIGNFAANFLGKKLCGYKTIIGAVCGFLFVIISIAGKIFPDLGMPGTDQDWTGIIKQIMDLVQILSGAGAVTMLPTGVVCKAYKAGLMTPTPDLGREQAVQRVLQDPSQEESSPPSGVYPLETEQGPNDGEIPKKSV